ncbi:heme exporter protein CcmD [Veronia nyctiphanis]|uniref:Heme exporter protein D n=1 Tax=Veronia nyctiphanis TaxID=1278244 RepID=A0A4Q0YVE3_9GAMM|nr:heme exporter protein CcmD [Veronia nyctiphanis]RXJ72941.1 heme exporter protein CcmD [Veronia nyctiphanis]
MHFDSFSDFLAMGGYAYYVWAAFGITFVSMVGVVLSSALTHRRLLRGIKNNVAREERIQKAKDMENTL